MADQVDASVLWRASTHAGISGLVAASRIFFVSIPESTSIGTRADQLENALVIHRVSEIPEAPGSGLDGGLEHWRARFQFSAYSTTHADARAIASEVKAAFQGYQDGTIKSCDYAGGGMDLYVPDTRVHHIPTDFFVSY